METALVRGVSEPEDENCSTRSGFCWNYNINSKWRMAKNNSTITNSLRKDRRNVPRLEKLSHLNVFKGRKWETVMTAVWEGYLIDRITDWWRKRLSWIIWFSLMNIRPRLFAQSTPQKNCKNKNSTNTCTANTHPTVQSTPLTSQHSFS